MSALPEDSVQDGLDAQLQQLAAGNTDQQPQIIQQVVPNGQTPESATARKPKAPSVRRACVACHTGKTRCSEVLPCQSCLKRGLGASCAYPDPDVQNSGSNSNSSSANGHHDSSHSVPSFAPPMYAAVPTHPPAVSTPVNMNHTQYYDYNGHFTGASSSSFRPSKRPRPLTDEEAQAITRNFSRGDFYVGSSAPVRIDPRLPVRLTLGEGDNVHFTVGDAMV
ncbi:hypothetical protein F5878DRAFT_599526 [Lentinula raphanica]|uniref:Zn(2)-C6 fungal-type domain-containing protein n=1 Tax=Lentinula raphanica TaxID=153919 RepID=A0AA38PLS7_9AGAR|nr:hypothetical protein EV360DRAFT_79792 [Lentinula raphanica]KAJ3845304.1 hypothetical protein F5878DRAFT_599526 [Lentinula raphanica]